MKNVLKVAVASGVLALGSALPVTAQIETAMVFTTSVPFYAGNSQMPPGTYKISQIDLSTGELLLRSTDGRHSAFMAFIPTFSEETQQKSTATFARRDGVEYLDQIGVMGENYGIKFPPTTAKLKAASNAGSEEHPVVGN
jgi:hypothetical protein